MVNVAVYARVSTKDRGQECENQLRELREFVERKSQEGWRIAGEYIDQASGGSAFRPAFQKMLIEASEKRFDLILFWSLDRFSREGVLETLQHLHRLTNQGIEWWSFKEEYLRSVGIFRDAVLSILATIAKQERVRLPGQPRTSLRVLPVDSQPTKPRMPKGYGWRWCGEGGINSILRQGSPV